MELQTVKIPTINLSSKESPDISEKKLKLKTVDVQAPIKHSLPKSSEQSSKSEKISKITQDSKRQEIKQPTTENTKSKESAAQVVAKKSTTIKQNQEVQKESQSSKERNVQTSKKKNAKQKETISRTKSTPIVALANKTQSTSFKDMSLSLNPNIKNVSEQMKQNFMEKIIRSSVAEKPRKKKGSHKKKLVDIQTSGFTQKLVNVKDIKGGIIVTKNNRYVQIIEILPINFSQKTEREKEHIVNNFEMLFKNGPTKGQFKTVMEYADTEQIINNIYRCCPNTREKHIVERRDDYIQTIRSMNQGITLHYRYFYIYEYEGSQEKGYSNQFENVYREMMMYKYSVKNILEESGNIVVFPENETKHTADILYRHFNRGIYMEQNLTQRILRINYDYNQFNRTYGTQKQIIAADYISPHYFASHSKWYVLENQMFKSWLIIKSDGYPSAVPPEWLNIIRVQGDMDVDFYYKKLHHELTKETMEKRANLHNNLMRGKSAQKTSGSSLESQTETNNYILQKLRQGEDLYDCCTILTVYAKSLKELEIKVDEARNKLRNKGIQVEKANRKCNELYQMTAPLCQINGTIFTRYRRNIMTSGMKNLYNYTAFSLYDETGVVLGPNINTGTMTVFNSFNTEMYTNGNIIIFGTPGSGKSFLEMSLGNRKIIMNEKCIYILPTKGYEYQDFGASVGASYIRMVPGGEHVINLMEIFPKQNIDIEKVGRTGESIKNDSALAEKITSLITWLSMLMVHDGITITSIEESKLNVLLKKLYYSFGFTDDNESLWLDKEQRVKRPMPIIGDWKKALEKDPDLEKYAYLLSDFTEGNYSNFNGQTNVDLSADCIIFDCEITVIGKRKLPAILYIAFDCADSIIKADTEHFGSLFLDEVWRILVNKQSAERIEEEARLLRGYGGAVIMATQDIVEFMENKYGKVILGTAAIKLVLKMVDTEAALVKDILNLDENDLSFIQRCKRGTGILISNGNKTRFALKTSESEEYYYTTDLNVKRKFQQKLAEKKQSKNLHLN